MFFSHFNIISYIFSRRFSWNSLSLSEDMNFCFFNFSYFRQFFGFFNLYLLQKKTNDVSIYKIISTVVWHGIVLDCRFSLELSYINIGWHTFYKQHFISNARMKLAKIKQMLSNTLRLNFCCLVEQISCDFNIFLQNWLRVWNF